ncbi:uncharacterized protein EI97DRAFT_455389 [Westerdykella ornata]|uniref:Uncharacterized protein n=1 Tax=Westerdykella ornata TaxID=318751 RepID=A0A6A6JZK5_WESOR|nr:uncharacterized protein EI97DRAFT_455389 [Westerdykella ornata]KAF2280499.1 hypothetical protein EI97DRAFT_455389 [Westerdykella ornata]
MRHLPDPRCYWLCPLTLCSPKDSIIKEPNSATAPPTRTLAPVSHDSNTASPIFTPEDSAEPDSIPASAVSTPDSASDADTEVLEPAARRSRSKSRCELDGTGNKDNVANVHEATNSHSEAFPSSWFTNGGNSQDADAAFVSPPSGATIPSSPPDDGSGITPRQTAPSTPAKQEREEPFVPDWTLVADILTQHGFDATPFRWAAVRQASAHEGNEQERETRRRVNGYAGPWQDVYKHVYGPPAPTHILRSNGIPRRGKGGLGEDGDEGVILERVTNGKDSTPSSANKTAKTSHPFQSPSSAESWPWSWFHPPNPSHNNDKTSDRPSAQNKAQHAGSLLSQKSHPKVKDSKPTSMKSSTTSLGTLPLKSTGSFAPAPASGLLLALPVPDHNRTLPSPPHTVSIPRLGRGNTIPPPPGFDRVEIRPQVGGWYSIGESGAGPRREKRTGRLRRVVQDREEEEEEEEGEGKIVEMGVGYMGSDTEEEEAVVGKHGRISEYHGKGDGGSEGEKTAVERELGECLGAETEVNEHDANAMTAKQEHSNDAENSNNQVQQENADDEKENSAREDDDRDSVIYADADSNTDTDSLYSPY